MNVHEVDTATARLFGTGRRERQVAVRLEPSEVGWDSLLPFIGGPVVRRRERGPASSVRCRVRG